MAMATSGGPPTRGCCSVRKGSLTSTRTRNQLVAASDILAPMEHLTIERRPDLHDPVAVVAFAGWNDAASAATNAARFIIRRLGARRFATIDPEPFFDFRESRPTVRINSKGERTINWPSNEFF